MIRSCKYEHSDSHTWYTFSIIRYHLLEHALSTCLGIAIDCHLPKLRVFLCRPIRSDVAFHNYSRVPYLNQDVASVFLFLPISYITIKHTKSPRLDTYIYAYHNVQIVSSFRYVDKLHLSCFDTL